MDGFKFFQSYAKALNRLNDKDRGILIKKICDFMFENIEPEFNEKEEKQELIWLGIEANLVNSKNKSRKKN